MVINLKTGDIWGFPTLPDGTPFAADLSETKPPVVKPIYIGRFDFSAMYR